MRKCLNCGAQNYDIAKECSNCRFPLDPIDYKEIKRSYQTTTEKSNNNLKTCAKAFLILGTVAYGVITLIYAILWLLSFSIKDNFSTVVSAIYFLLFLILFSVSLFMTINYCNKINNKEPVGIAFKICALLFIGLIPGILMLCDAND